MIIRASAVLRRTTRSDTDRRFNNLSGSHGDINNHITEQQLKTNHRIDWDSAKCATYSTN